MSRRGDHYSRAMREYGVTRKDLERFDRNLDDQIVRRKQEGKYLTFKNAGELRHSLEKSHRAGLK